MCPAAQEQDKDEITVTADSENADAGGLTAMAKATVAAAAAATTPAASSLKSSSSKVNALKSSSTAEDPSNTQKSAETALERVENDLIDAEGAAAPLAAIMGSLEEDHFEGDEIHVELYDSSFTFEAINKFEDLNLPEELLRGLYVICYRTPSKIQKKALPLLLANPPRNMIAQSQSGTGKTGAFVLTMLCRVDPALHKVQAICIANTRELASQIHATLRNMASCANYTSLLAVPDTAIQDLRQFPNMQIIVGTPGTILAQIRRNRNSLSCLRVFVLDEADSMLQSDSLGEQCRQLRAMVPNVNEVQFLLFSATFSDNVTIFADTFAPRANKLTLRRHEVKVDSIRQFALRVDKNNKLKRLAEIYGLMTIGQSIIFVKTKMGATRVAKFMMDNGHKVSVLMGELSSQERDATMESFRNGTSKVLIATNVLSRGIDVPQVNLVINFDMPVDEQGYPDSETYVHRIGRTGRFGRSGVAINFICDNISETVQSHIQQAYAMKIAEMPNDLDEMEKMLRKFKF